MRGAEAIMRKGRLLGQDVLIKDRIAKGYRVKSLDERLRRERTRGEARLLHKAKREGVPCPTVLQIEDFSITMSVIKGKRPEMNKNQAHRCGEMLAKLHAADIIHGDYTPANILEGKGGLFVIDFGLGFISKDVEDKAIDVFTMLRAVSEKEAFLLGYGAYADAVPVLKRVKAVEGRVRYAT
uniref:non-specific serine/threonine protein kinase n=1 Tax=Candidatus Methanophaga sp. ANME-1 ERB7 TaxID=2759913 RepID=A0A7G9Z2F2_9EURY|nr:putative bifunctional tRNA threonylcarbamoyladenosine biosynthesis protein [Methanosarcinales archaeon ANME-1 ERB7]